MLVVRPSRGAPAATVVSDPGQVSLNDVAISARGHAAVAWTRSGILEGRVREPSGALSPVGQLTAAGTSIGEACIAVDSNGVTDLAAVVPAPAAPGTSVVAVIAAHRPAGGAFTGPVLLDNGPQIDSLKAVAAGSEAADSSRGCVPVWDRRPR